MIAFVAPVAAGALECADLSSADALAKHWREDAIYFRPERGIVAPVWVGTVYVRDSKKCCSLLETDDALKSKERTCPKALLRKARVRPAKIRDFGTFRAKFKACLDKRDGNCLKPFLSTQVRGGFGFDVYGDLRELALKKWGRKGLTRMKTLLAKGVVGSGDRRSFPPKPDKKGLGWRGTFIKTEQGWQLESFLTGQ